MAKTCDQKCYELAQYFLTNDEPAELMSLACAIQGAVEDWMEEQLAEAEEKEKHDDEQRSLRGYSDEERERI